MSKLVNLVKGRRGTISALALAVVVAVPVVVAATHEGYPVSTGDLDPRTVWVTNSDGPLAGRLSRTIKELDGSVYPKSTTFDVFQDAEAVLIRSETEEGTTTLARVDPAFTVLEGEALLSAGSLVSYGRGVIAILRPSDGGLWILSADQPIDVSGDPALVLGKDARAIVATTGTVFAYSAEQRKLYTVPPGGSSASTRDFTIPAGESELSAVGDKPIVLMKGTTTVILSDGSMRELPEVGLRLQQPGPDADSILVSTGTALLEVPFASGEPVQHDGGLDTPSTQPSDAAAPVRLGDCIYAAWASAGREVHQCADRDPVGNDIDRPTAGDQLVFRVNRSVIVLNNIRSGDSWVIEDTLTLVDNWDDVEPEDVQKTSEGQEEASEDNFEEQIATRTEDNRTPVALADSLGARPGRATVLAVLDNDNDEDGDVLTITDFEAIPESQGVIEIIDGGRALQFTSAPGVNGTISTRYDVTDGRPNGTATAAVDIAVSATADQAPVQQRVTSVNVEEGQSISYNVLADWRDPDGDEVFLKSASASSGDTVRRTPDGIVSFTHTTTELGQKTVDVMISDGSNEVAGTLIFNVQKAGSLNPLGVPDFATTFVNKSVVVKPLENDRSPSGKPLTLVSVEPYDAGVSASRPGGTGEFTFTSPKAGDFYLKYTVSAGSTSSVGLVRVNVTEDPDSPLPPIAVRDVAYLRPNQSIDLGVLQNDLSPSGRVIGIQSIDVPIDETSITVEVLKNTLLRVSSSEALATSATASATSGTFSFEYTISDGVSEATATVVVVPVPPLANNQPPIAKDDSATVRVGDIVSVPVLDNDVHPDGAVMHVSTEFATPLPEGSGFAFVANDEVRFQAPNVPGNYQLNYIVTDDFQQMASAFVTFTVNPLDDATNQAPVPRDLEARVFAGSTFRIDVPFTEVDPDGDSTRLVGVTKSPSQGIIVAQGDDWFRYEAYPEGVGTDAFTYMVEDSFGALGQATVRIGVLPPPTDALPPSAVDDPISLRPDRTGTVAVLANDSDPSGFPLSLDSVLDVPEGIEARIVDSQLVVSASDEGLFTIGYSVANGHGGTDRGYVIVTVDTTAPLLPPIAIDHVVETADSAGKTSVDVDPRVGAQSPSGLVADLEVDIIGPGASFGEVGDDGSVTVTLGDARRVVAYTLTSPDGLSATAFIAVPRKVSENWAPPPFLKPDLTEQVVSSGQTRTWNLEDILVVPSGRAPLLVDDVGVSASNSNDESLYVDENTISFRSAEGYSGPASITFHVTDGASPSDPDGNDSFVTLPITVTGGGDEAVIAPVFATRTIIVVVGETATLDLRAATDHPDQGVKNGLGFDGLVGSTTAVEASISGATLDVTAAPGTTGETASLSFRISGSGVEATVASVQVLVVPSDKPLAQVQDDQVLTTRPTVETVSPLVNDGNPFGADKPLTIIAAVIEDNGAPGAAVSHTASTVRLVPAPGFVGTFSVLYTVMDYTQEKSREVSARIEFVYRDVPSNNVPAEPDSSVYLVAGDGQVTVTLHTQPAPNNAAIDQYEVIASNGATQTCGGSLNCSLVFGSLPNGVPISFTARARNVIGWGATWTVGTRTPWGTPAPPPSASIATHYGGIDMYWINNGGDAAGVTYTRWEMVSGSSESNNVNPGVASASISRRTPPGPSGPFQFRVAACNPVYCSGWTYSPPVDQPITPTWTLSRGAVANISGTPGNRVLVTFDGNTQLGTYQMCATTGNPVWWWYWNSGGGNTPTQATRSDCGTVTVTATRTVEPFGWVIANGQSANITIRLTNVTDNITMTVN